MKLTFYILISIFSLSALATRDDSQIVRDFIRKIPESKNTVVTWGKSSTIRSGVCGLLISEKLLEIYIPSLTQHHDSDFVPTTLCPPSSEENYLIVKKLTKEKLTYHMREGTLFTEVSLSQNSDEISLSFLIKPVSRPTWILRKLDCTVPRDK